METKFLVAKEVPPPTLGAIPHNYDGAKHHTWLNEAVAELEAQVKDDPAHAGELHILRCRVTGRQVHSYTLVSSGDVVMGNLINQQQARA